jgi:L-rhamnose-H+ transport protein
MASIIVFSSLWGLKLGEWKGSSIKSRQLLYTALGTLILSTVIIGIAAYIKGSSGAH